MHQTVVAGHVPLAQFGNTGKIERVGVVNGQLGVNQRAIGSDKPDGIRMPVFFGTHPDKAVRNSGI